MRSLLWRYKTDFSVRTVDWRVRTLSQRRCWWRQERDAEGMMG